MGRALKRVPMDFAWPRNKVWGGYLNPHSRASTTCDACDGTGYGPEAKRFHAEWWGYVEFDPVAYGSEPLTIDNPALQEFARRQCARDPDYYGTGPRAIAREARRMFGYWRNQWQMQLSQADVDALIADGGRHDLTHTRTNESGWQPRTDGHVPTPAEFNAHAILAPLSHPNAYVCMNARCAREGVEKLCSRCVGEGRVWTTPEAKTRAEAWEFEEPPVGDGFQLWETTSEGSPISPVFATLDELCTYAADHCSTFGAANFVTKERWREMLDADHVYHQEGGMVFL